MKKKKETIVVLCELQIAVPHFQSMQSQAQRVAQTDPIEKWPSYYYYYY